MILVGARVAAAPCPNSCNAGAVTLVVPPKFAAGLDRLPTGERKTRTTFPLY
jgi:hypothetical protein